MQKNRKLRILVIFGSSSDEPAFSKVASALKKTGAKSEVRIASAHRTPELVRKLAAKNWDFIIAGAGMAAALPGVVAAETIRPVFGVPVDSSLDGLDAFLSIAQMPPGIPVLTLPPGSAAAAEWIKENMKYLSRPGFLEGVNFVIPGRNGMSSGIVTKALAERVDKAIDMLYSMNVPVMISDSADEKSVNIAATLPTGKEAGGNIGRGTVRRGLTIHVPVVKTGKPKPKHAVELLKKASRHKLLLTGFNRFDNAAIAAAQILNAASPKLRLEIQLGAALLSQRKKAAKKVLLSDREIRKKYSEKK